MAERVVVIRHGDDPPDDRVYTYLEAAGRNPQVVRPYAGEELVFDGSVTGTVIHGGNYNPEESDQHPFMIRENSWIAGCMAAGLPVLGICQGAQQIAHVLGAYTGPARSGMYEWGYYEVRPVAGAEDFLPRPTYFTQSHFHEFDVPDGAELLADSPWVPAQAFRHGEKTYAIQFHPEVTPAGMRRWQDKKTAHYGKPGAQTREEQDRLMELHDPAQHDWFMDFMGKLFPARG